MNHTPGMIYSCFEQEEVGKTLNGLRLRGFNDLEIAIVKQHLYTEIAPAFIDVLSSSILWK